MDHLKNHYFNLWYIIPKFFSFFKLYCNNSYQYWLFCKFGKLYGKLSGWNMLNEFEHLTLFGNKKKIFLSVWYAFSLLGSVSCFVCMKTQTDLWGPFQKGIYWCYLVFNFTNFGKSSIALLKLLQSMYWVYLHSGAIFWEKNLVVPKKFLYVKSIVHFF